MFVRYFNNAPSVIQQDADTSEKSFSCAPLDTHTQKSGQNVFDSIKNHKFYGALQWEGWFDRGLCEVGCDRTDFQMSSALSAFLLLHEAMVALGFALPFSTC